MDLKNKLSILFLIIQFYSFSQNDYKEYHTCLNKIYELDSISNDSLIIIYEKAFTLATPFAEDVFDLALFYFNSTQTGNLGKAESMLEKSVLLGYQLKPDLKFKNDLFPEISYGYSFHLKDTTDQFTKFVSDFSLNKYDSLRAIYLQGCKKDIYFELLLANELYAQEVRLFSKGFLLKKKLNRDVFRPNAELMLKLLESNLLPKRRESRRFNQHSIMMLCNHIIAGFKKESDAKRFLTLLWNKVEEGEVTPYEYVLAYEHYIAHFVNFHKSYYGNATTYIFGKKKVLKLIQPKSVNERRKQIWLTTLENYCKDYNLKLPANYK